MSDEARRIATFYLVGEVRAGSPALPIDEQFRIVWRCSRPSGIPDTPGAVCVLFDRLMMGDTFWPGELFVRRAPAEPGFGAFPVQLPRS